MNPVNRTYREWNAGRILIERRSQGRLRLAILRMRLGVVQTDRDEGIDLRPLAERNGTKAGCCFEATSGHCYETVRNGCSGRGRAIGTGRLFRALARSPCSSFSF